MKYIFLFFFLLAFHFTFPQTENLAITNIKLYGDPDLPPIEDATVLIKNGKVKRVGHSRSLRIPRKYIVIDGTGRFATAGYWNSHVHLIGPTWSNATERPSSDLEKQLTAMLTGWGFVYAFDLAQFDFDNLNVIRSRIKRGELKGPTLYAVGEPFSSRSPYYIHPAKLPELTTIAEVRQHINEQLKKGANGIKIWSASPTGKGVHFMPDSLIQEAARMMNHNGLPLFAHPTSNAGMLRAISNGVSILTHVSPDGRADWDSVTVHEIIQKGTAVIPTLKLFSWEQKREGLTDDDKLSSIAIDQLSAFNKAGGLILFGTDVGYMTDYNPLDEFIMMSKAGMNFSQILKSLTVNPSRKFGYKNRKGKVIKNYDADIVILNSDPSFDIKNFCDVEMTIHKGNVIYKRSVN